MTTTEFLTLIGAPWAACHDHPEKDTAKDLANIRPSNGRGYDTVCGVFGCDYEGETGDVQRARRDLIAAAPELYEALYAIVSSVDDGGVGFDRAESFWSSIDAARAALAKASGETGEQS